MQMLGFELCCRCCGLHICGRLCDVGTQLQLLHALCQSLLVLEQRICHTDTDQLALILAPRAVDSTAFKA